jgi:hypothetical protein
MDDKPKFAPKDFRDLTTTTFMQRDFVYYPIEEDELDNLASGETSLHFTLFGISLGALLSAITTLETATLSQKAQTFFDCLFFVSLLATLCFGGMALKNFGSARKRVGRIKRRSKPMEAEKLD